MGRPMVDAHNCYPYDGQWGDRIDRALSAGFPVSIEQDLTWYVDPRLRQSADENPPMLIEVAHWDSARRVLRAVAIPVRLVDR